MVFISCVVQISATAGGAGALRLGGFPFPCGPAQSQRGGFKIDFVNGFVAGLAPEVAVIDAGAQFCTFIRRATADVRDNLNVFLIVADLPAATLMYFHGFYFLPPT
jgi:hypothetical protein